MNEWCCVFDAIPSSNRDVLITIEPSLGSRVVAVDRYNEQARLFESEVKNRENNMADRFHVIAWMDFPEPWIGDMEI